MRSMSLWVFASLVIGCSSGDVSAPQGDGSHQVDAVGVSSWNPTPITIKAGEAVTFRNATGAVHNVQFDQGAVGRPGNVSDFASASRSVVFMTAGSFAYHCGIHPAMQGQVVVQP
jgi:plastocyanin